MIPSTIFTRSRYLTRLSSAQLCSNPLQIEHDPDLSEFNIHLQDSKAYISYTFDKKNKQFCLNHTEVPPVFQGKGVGKKLVEAALQHAVENKMNVKILCDFAQKYYKDNESRFKNLTVT